MDTGTAREDHEKIKARYYTSNHIVTVNNVQIPTLKQKGYCIKMYFLVPCLEIWTTIDTAPYKDNTFNIPNHKTARNLYQCLQCVSCFVSTAEAKQF